MQSAYTMKRARAHSDPGVLISDREEFEMQPMGAPVRPNVRIPFDERATSHGQTLPTGSRQDSLPASAAMNPSISSDVSGMAKSARRTPVAAMLNTPTRIPAVDHTSEVNTEHTTSRGQRDSSAQSQWITEPEITSLQSATSLSIGRVATSGLECGLQVRPVRPSIKITTEQNAPSISVDAAQISLEISSITSSAVPSSSIRNATFSQVLPIEAQVTTPPTRSVSEPESPGPVPNDMASDTERFFRKYSRLMPPPEFNEFRSMIGRERKFQAQLWRHLSDGFYGASEWTPSSVHDLDTRNQDILLIEDVDVRCVMALDTAFDLDPQFILSYAGFRKAAEFRYIPTPVDNFHYTGTEYSRSWYTMVGKVEGGCSWRTDGSKALPRKEWQSDLKLWKHRGASGVNRPWCQEARRQGVPNQGSRNHSFTSIVACYSLSKTLRESNSGISLRYHHLSHTRCQAFSLSSQAPN